jgi:hypothetical protein
MKKLLYFAAILAIVGVSCVKKEFDLNKDNLDLTVKIGGNEIHVPIARTDTLRIGDFLDVDEIDMIRERAGAYEIFVMDSVDIDIPSDFGDLTFPGFNENFSIDPIEFAAYATFPDLPFPDYIYIDDIIDSEFGLPGFAIIFLDNFILPEFLPSGISPAQINTEIKNGDFTGVTDTLPLSASFDTIIRLEISQSLDGFEFIDSVKTVYLGKFMFGSVEKQSGFSVTIPEFAGVPNGISLTLDTLRLIFPNNIFLQPGAEGVINPHLFQRVGMPVTGGGPFEVHVPIMYITDVYDAASGKDIEISDSIKVFATYSMGGAYTGGNFPNSSIGQSTWLHLQLQPGLSFSNADITLNLNNMLADINQNLPNDPFEININQPFDNQDIVIKEITSVVLDNGGAEISVNFNLAAETAGQTIANAIKVEIEIDFPNFFTLTPRSKLNNLTNVFRDTISFTGGPQVILFNLESFNLNQSITDNTIVISDEIDITTNVWIDRFTINTDTLLQTVLNLDVAASIGDIKFKEVNGKIEFEIPWEEDISVDLLGELPDIIMNNRDSIFLDVNPYLELTLNSNLGISLDPTITLTAIKSGAPPVEVAITIPIDGNKITNKLFIADTNVFMQSGYTWVKPNDGKKLNSIISNVPDEIVISVSGGIDPTQTVTFDLTRTDYDVDMKYNFIVPLAFGPSFRIVMTDTIADLEPIIGELLDGNKIGLTAHITNNIPLNITATPIPIDSNNRPLDVEVTSFKIQGSTTTATSVANLEINDSKKQLINMRGIILKFEADTKSLPPGAPLGPDNFIQLRLSARIEGGVTIDLNNLPGSNKNNE